MIRKWSTRRTAQAVMLAVVLFLGMGLGVAITRSASAETRGVAHLKLQGGGTPLSLPGKVDIQSGFSAVSEAVKQAVVNITTKATVRMRHPEVSPFGDDMFRRFFGEDSPGGGSQVPRTPRDFIQRGVGSGVIVDSSGYIITNAHVAEGADSITVKLHDGTELEGKLLGVDSATQGGTDLAVLKVSPSKPLPFAKLGNIDDMKVGDWVIAIGSPFGLEQTVTSGIVSAMGRSVPTQSFFTNYIQTDAAINPGNSGGPLVNMRGEVIGLNTFIETRSGGNLGIGFAIPSNVIANVYNQIVDSGKVVRGQLGIYMNTLPMTDAMRKFFRMKDAHGVIVTDLQEGDSPARKAGIQPDDILLEFDGKPVESPDALRSMVANTTPGTEVPVRVLRGSEEKLLTVKLAERQTPPARAESRSMDLDEEEKSSKPEIGLTVVDLTARLASQLGFKAEDGVLVEEVRPGSVAYEAGLASRDLIVAMDGRAAASASSFVEKVRSMKSGESVVLKFKRAAENGQVVTFFTSLTKP